MSKLESKSRSSSTATATATVAPWYVSWASSRILRDQLEPILNMNKEAALLTLTPTQLQIQAVDKFFTSVFQRTFWAGHDYQLTRHDTLSQVPGPPNPQIMPVEGGGALWEGVVEFGAIYDILCGCTPGMIGLFGNTTTTTTTTTTTVSSSVGASSTSSKVAEEEETECDDEEEDAECDDDDRKTGSKKKKATGPSKASKGPVQGGGGHEEKNVWRFSGQPLSSNSVTLDVKLRFAKGGDSGKDNHNNHNNNNNMDRKSIFSGFMSGPHASFDAPMLGSTTAACDPMPTSTISVAPIPANAVTLTTTDWQNVPIVSHYPVITPIMEFAHCTPPRFYKLDTTSSWWNPAAGVRVSTRNAADLQDDFIHLAPHSDTCEITVSEDDQVQLMAVQKRARKAYILRNHAVEQTATPSQQQQQPATGKKSTSNSNNSSSNNPSSNVSTGPRTNFARGKYQIEHIPQKKNHQHCSCSFLLRPFRIFHKIVGSSSRVEWTIPRPSNNNNNNNSSTNNSSTNNINNHNNNNNNNLALPQLMSGPMVVAFYQGNVTSERIAAVILTLRLPPKKPRPPSK